MIPICTLVYTRNILQQNKAIWIQNWKQFTYSVGKNLLKINKKRPWAYIKRRHSSIFMTGFKQLFSLYVVYQENNYQLLKLTIDDTLSNRSFGVTGAERLTGATEFFNDFNFSEVSFGWLKSSLILRSNKSLFTAGFGLLVFIFLFVSSVVPSLLLLLEKIIRSYE